MARVGARLRAAVRRDQPGPRHHRRAVGAVARRRREQIAVAVGDADIGGVGLGVGVAARPREIAKAAAGLAAELAGRRHFRPGAVGADQLAALGRVFLGDQGRERHLDQSPGRRNRPRGRQRRASAPRSAGARSRRCCGRGRRGRCLRASARVCSSTGPWHQAPQVKTSRSPKRRRSGGPTGERYSARSSADSRPPSSFIKATIFLAMSPR